MKLFRYRLTPESPLGTPLQSDTIMGHLLCYAGEIKGINALEGIISRFLEGDPPFIVSSAFPSGKLPRPETHAMGREALNTLVREKKNSVLFYKKEGATFKSLLANAIRDYKDFKKNRFIDTVTWEKNKQGMSEESLFLAYLKEDRETRGPDGKEWKTVANSHNTIDRRAMTVAGEGGLFFTSADFFKKGFSFDLYARVQPDFQETFERLLNQFSTQGYGRDRSSGKGVFNIIKDAAFQPDTLEVPDGNDLLNLSIFSSTDMGNWEGTYQLMTKYGRVWNGFGENNPFKKPFIAFREGSVFKKREVDYAACVLKDIHSNGAIIQCTLPLFIPFQWEVS